MKYPDAVIITGASRGLGKAVALDLLDKGVMIIGLSRTNPKIDNPNFFWMNIDLSASPFYYANYLKYRLDTTLEMWSAKNIGIILCAGITGKPHGLIDSDLDLDKWSEVYQTNVIGNLVVIKCLLEHMINVAYGRIVFLSGGGAAFGFFEFSAYALSKVAIVREVENLAIELSSKGNFSVVALAPGAMETDMLNEMRKVGVMPKTTVDIQEPINFINAFLQSKNQCLNGRFIHVRDNWQKYLLDNNKKFLDEEDENKWLLRRIEK